MDIEVIEVEVDDQAQTSALGALSDAAAAQALRVETRRAPSPKIARASVAPPPAPKAQIKADGTQEIEIGDVLEVMQKMPTSKGGSKIDTTPKVELAALAVETPAAPINPNATAEIRPGDVLEEIVIEEPAPLPAPVSVAAAIVPPPANSGSDLAQTVLRTTATASASLPLPQFGADEEVAPFASDTVDIPIDRVAGLPIWLQIKGKPQLAIVAGAVGACVLIGALAIGMHLHSASSGEPTAQTTHATASINAAMHHEDPSAAIPPPPAQPDVPSVSIDDLQKDGRAGHDTSAAPTHAWSGSAHARTHAPPQHHADTAPPPPPPVTTPVTHHADAAPAHPHVSAPPPAAAASKPQGFGLIRTWIAARGEPISVDGKVVGTAPTPARVACGEHTVAIGKEVVHASVPCDGTVTVGSPDHHQ